MKISVAVAWQAMQVALDRAAQKPDLESWRGASAMTVSFALLLARESDYPDW